MSSAALLRVASRTTANPLTRFTTAAAPKWVAPSTARTASPVRLENTNLLKRGLSSSVSRRSGPHEEETFEEFTARYEAEFERVSDVFELQRNLNNSFAYDLVPSTTVIVAALRAARRVNDFPTAVRIFEGIKAKVENKAQYDQYLEELEGVRKELGIELRESLYPDLGDRI
ncbi:MAG: hypothetical protein Q9162_005401 [Coniocarpon cinnabarinum]